MKQFIYTRTVAGILIILGLFITRGTQAQIINTFAGNGTSTSSGDGGYCTASGLNYPFAACVDDSGNVYIADCSGNRIRKVNAVTGIITTVAGNGSQGFSPDGTAATAAEINRPQGVAVDTAGNIYFTGYNSVVTEVVKSTGLLKTVAGGGAGGGTDGLGDGLLASNAIFSTPTIGVAVDDSGNVYVVDHYNARVRKITAATGIITSIVGAGSNGGTDGVGDGGPGTGANLNQPDGIAIDDSENVYIADQWHHAIRKLTAATGIITSIAGTITAGNGVAGYSGDGGQATASELNVCSGVAVDASGNVFIADTYNNKIREITKATGIINTVAGNNADLNNSTGAYSGDGGPATAAQLAGPYDVTVDGCGNVYSVESNDDRVRIVYVPDSVKVNPNPASTCSGSSITLKASGAITYTWSPTTGLNATTGDSVIATPTIATTYTLTGANTCGGGVTFVSATVVVTIGASFAVSVTPDSPSVCNGQHITLTAQGGNTYQWVGTPDNTDSISVNPSKDTTYELMVGNGTCSRDTFISVYVKQAPALIIQPPSPASVCLGQSVILTVPVSGTDYAWSPSATLSSSTADTVVATPFFQTTYVVTGIDSLGCIVTSDSEVVTINTGPSKPTITEHDSLLISSSTQSNQWLRNDTIIQGATNQDYTVTIEGYYQVTVSNPANGCSTTSDSIFPTPEGVNRISINRSELSVYPNPTNGEIILNISSSVAEVKDWDLQITDVLGRTVYSKEALNYNNEIDLSNLPGGVYFIAVINKNGRVVVPVVKQ